MNGEKARLVLQRHLDFSSCLTPSHVLHKHHGKYCQLSDPYPGADQIVACEPKYYIPS